MTEQTNPYIKQFPELMKDKTILYVHGFGSSGQSGTVTRIRDTFPNAAVIAPDLPVHPQEAMDLLNKVCATERPSLIIGTSMGGMYGEMLYGTDRILVNPAFGIADTMAGHGMTGKQQFQNPRRDGVQEFYVDKALVKEYRTVSEGCFARAGEPGEQQRVYGLFGDQDTLVHTRDAFGQHYLQAIPFHGEHRMNDRSFMHAVVPVVRWIDDRQEKRERPIVYIGTETLYDPDRQQPTASAQKAVRLLIEHYQVYFAAFTLPDGCAATETMLTQHFGVPAWGRTVFTNQRHLLYGDYLIQGLPELRLPLDSPEPMATEIAYGSDTFKTWDDIIEYFSRLGGQ